MTARSFVAIFAAISALASVAGAQTPITRDKQVLTLAAARAVVTAAEAEANRRGFGVVTVVVDDAGTIIQLSRMDGAQVGSVNVGIGKARTAALFRRKSSPIELLKLRIHCRRGSDALDGADLRKCRPTDGESRPAPITRRLRSIFHVEIIP